MTNRSGIGIDTHALVDGRPLTLGGISIPFDKGLSGHSDGDVLIHAIIDALLGGAGLGDIGTHFPSSDPQYKDVASTELLQQTLDLLKNSGWRATYVDATILAEQPTLSPFIKQIAQSLATSLNMVAGSVNLKAKSTDGLGFIGRGEGITAMSIAILEPTE